MKAWILWGGIKGDGDYYISGIYRNEADAHAAADKYNSTQDEDDSLYYYYYVSPNPYKVQ